MRGGALRTLAIGLGLAPAALLAQSPIGILISEQARTAFSVQGAGARAAGLGGAFIAVADDATAVSFNPAGLAQFQKPEFSFVGRGLTRNVDFQDVTAATGTRNVLADDDLNSGLRFDPLLLSGAIPLRLDGRMLTLQLAAQRLFPLSENDNRVVTENPAQNPQSVSMVPYTHLSQRIVQRGQVDVYSFAMSYELSQRILAGFSMNVWRGAWDLDTSSSKTVPVLPPGPGPVPPGFTGGKSYSYGYTQSDRLEGSNFNLGLLWRMGAWKIGAVTRTAFRADYTFSSTTTNILSPGPSRSSAVTTGLHWPSTSGLGVAYRPSETWLATADLTYTAWSGARFMSDRGDLSGRNFFDLDKQQRTPNATALHLGLEHLLLTDSLTLIPVRVGFNRDPQPVVDRVTGEQRVMLNLSAGTGLKRGDFTMDVAYTYSWGSRRVSQFLDVDEILSHYRPVALGQERIREQRLDISMAVQFERKPVQDFLHKIFVGD